MIRESNKKARETVEENLKYIDKPELCEIVDMIRPYYSFTKEQLMERELRNKARYIMSSFKDGEKIRTYYLNNDGVYINIEKSTDLGDLDKVDIQLSAKYSGLTAAISKVRNRIDGVIDRFKRRRG